jgi:uncharacterized membrane protein YhiD involved in acid resistance
MSKGTTFLVGIVVAVIIGGLIGLMRNEGITLGGGLAGVLGGIVAARVAMALRRPEAPNGSTKK